MSLTPLRTMLATSAFWGGLAHAQAPPPAQDASAVRAEDLAGLLIVAVDREAVFATGAPQVRVVGDDSEGQVVLADDGRSPDGIAGDGTWVAVMPAPPTGESLQLMLLDSAGTVLWQDAVPISAGLGLPRVDFEVVGSHVKTTLSTVSVAGSASTSGIPIAPPAPGTAGTPPPPPGTAGTPPPPPGTAGAALPSDIAGGAGLVIAGMLGLLGVLGGLGLGLLIGRRGHTALPVVPVGGPPKDVGPLPPTRGQQQRWHLHDPTQSRAVLSQLAVALAQRGPVLLVATPEDRAHLHIPVAGVVSLSEDRPPPQVLLDTAVQLQRLGQVTLLVQGAGALEAPESEEAHDAVLQELLEDAVGEADVVVIDGGPGAVAEVQLTADGLLVVVPTSGA